jgi:hypothetical protein
MWHAPALTVRAIHEAATLNQTQFAYDAAFALSLRINTVATLLCERNHVPQLNAKQHQIYCFMQQYRRGACLNMALDSDDPVAYYFLDSFALQAEQNVIAKFKY